MDQSQIHLFNDGFVNIQTPCLNILTKMTVTDLNHKERHYQTTFDQTPSNVEVRWNH